MKNLPVIQSLSHSRRQLIKTCPRKYWLRYELGLRSNKPPLGMLQGSYFSNKLETFFNGADFVDPFEEWLASSSNQTEYNALSVARDIAQVMYEEYIDHYSHIPDDMTREVEFDLPIGGSGYVNRGFIDGLSPDNSTLYEDKLFSSMFWRKGNEEQLKIDEQVTAYFAACRDLNIHIDKIAYRVTLKPALRQRKDELSTEYIARIRQALIDSPEKYFREFILTRTDEQIDDIQHEIEYYAGLLHRMKSDGFFPKNTGACADYGGCEFLPLCAGEVEDLSELYTKEGVDNE